MSDGIHIDRGSDGNHSSDIRDERDTDAGLIEPGVVSESREVLVDLEEGRKEGRHE